MIAKLRWFMILDTMTISKNQLLQCPINCPNSTGSADAGKAGQPSQCKIEIRIWSEPHAAITAIAAIAAIGFIED
jgi:hypothetical protein